MSIVEDLKHTFRGKNNGLMKLIVINVIVFVASNLFIGISKLSGNWGDSLYELFGLSPDIPYALAHFWTIVTYMFFHNDVFHILFNMLWLYWMGQLFVEFIGSKQLISTYLLGGICGGLLFIVYGLLFPMTLGSVILIGASAAVMAIVVAIAFLIPNYTIQVFLLGAVKLKYIALASFIISTMIDFYSNTGGKVAHIGGALYGYIFFVLYRKGVDLGKPIHSIIDWTGNLFKRRTKMKVAYKKSTNDELYNTDKLAKEKRINEILDKISKSGYDSLSKDEKEFLFKQK
jgi:membrane associated rhomboid family serine protease